jgi:uncharacterized protein YbaP (TraB family)
VRRTGVLARCVLSASAWFACISLNRAADAEARAELDVILVRGEQPGPALWKVSSGDNVLWIMGEVSPVPKKIRWRSTEFARALSSSKELLLEAEALGSGARITASQAAAIAKARYLPDGLTLKDVLPPELHSRLDVTRRLHRVPDDIETLQPGPATTLLLNTAIQRLDLRVFGINFQANELALRGRVPVKWIQTRWGADDHHTGTWELTQRAASIQCLEWAVRRFEDGGAGIRRLANAWSVGNVDALRELVSAYALVHESHRPNACEVANVGEQRARDFVMKRAENWLAEAERALRENRSTVAVVAIAELLDPEGYLAALRARGYDVTEPE